LNLFAYGTLMGIEGLRDALGDRASTLKLRPARLPGWRRIWNVYRPEWNGGVLNAEPSPDAVIVGVLVEGLAEEDFVRLDAQEATHLPREQVYIEPIGAEVVPAQVYRRNGDRFLLADALVATTLPYANLGQWDDVARLMREGLDIFESIDNKVGVAMVYEIIGAGLSFLGQHADAARMFGASEELRQRIGGGAPSQLLNTAAYRSLAEEALGAERFAQLRAEGGGLSDSAASALAHSFEAQPGSPALPPPEPWGVEAERRAVEAEAQK